MLETEIKKLIEVVQMATDRLGYLIALHPQSIVMKPKESNEETLKKPAASKPAKPPAKVEAINEIPKSKKSQPDEEVLEKIRAGAREYIKRNISLEIPESIDLLTKYINARLTQFGAADGKIVSIPPDRYEEVITFFNEDLPNLLAIQEAEKKIKKMEKERYEKGEKEMENVRKGLR